MMIPEHSANYILLGETVSKKRWNNKKENLCQGACQGKGGWIKAEDGRKDSCPDCEGTELGHILTPTPDAPSSYKVTAR